MNKQEVIEKLREHGAWCKECHDINGKKDRYVKAAKVRELLDQLDEPQPEKVEVPDYVAEWIEYAKKKGHAVIESANPWDLYGAEWKKADDWINQNQDSFARAFMDGYTVKPKRWVVKRKNGCYVNDFQEAKFCVGIGITLEMDCLPPFKFTDKSKAEAVAVLVEGSVEEV